MFPPKHFVTRIRLKSDLANALGWFMQPICFLRIGERPSRKAPPSPALLVPADRPPRNSGGHQIPTDKRAAPPASERDDVLTYISAKSARQDAESLPANDNQRATRADLSFLDLINDEDQVADIARRAERLGHATLIAMAIGLAALPLLFLTLG
jgi:hypothetical protein